MKSTLPRLNKLECIREIRQAFERIHPEEFLEAVSVWLKAPGRKSEYERHEVSLEALRAAHPDLTDEQLIGVWLYIRQGFKITDD